MNILIPKKEELFKGSVHVALAPRGTRWFQKCLGSHAKEKGVYVIFYKQSIIYVGKTNGKKMGFGMRLRRHFQETAAGNKHTYPKLSALEYPKEIKVRLIPISEIKQHIKHNLNNINELELAPLFESALILALGPEFQRS
jgi:hypothetical protein